MILALSPHLDDVVFSVGGYLYERAGAGARVEGVTVFTQSVPNPTGFALACQLDKGLDEAVDYMKVRRAEDMEACRMLGIEPVHWDFREAPHRGYNSAAELFAGIQPTDDLNSEELRVKLANYFRKVNPTEVLYPFGAGDHVDHLQLIAAVHALRPDFPNITFRQFYDMPYARKFAERYPELERGGAVERIELSAEAFERKMAACAAYGTQVGFQFGGVGRIGEVLGRVEYLR